MEMKQFTLIVSAELKEQVKSYGIESLAHILTYQNGLLCNDEYPYDASVEDSDKTDINIEMLDSAPAGKLVWLVDSKADQKFMDSVKSSEYYSSIVDDVFDSKSCVMSKNEFDKFICEQLKGIKLIPQHEDGEIFRFMRRIFDVNQALNIAKQLKLEIHNVAPSELLGFLALTAVDKSFTDIKDEPLLLAEMDDSILLIDGHHRLTQWQDRESVPIMIIPKEYLHLYYTKAVR